MMRFRYQEKHSFEERRVLGERMKMENEDRIPVIVEKDPKSKVDADNLSNGKRFLVPKNLNVGLFFYTIRQKIRLRPEQALCFFVNNVMPNTSLTMGELYEEYHDEDLLLYLMYCEENVYGA